MVSKRNAASATGTLSMEYFFPKKARSKGDETDVRSDMKDFWAAHSNDATVESMMFDTKASTLTEMESKEIMSMLPNIEGKRILELGAGIGRQTRLFAEKASHVTAVDFIETFVEKNRQSNGHLENVDFIQADVTKLDLPEQSYDIVFSNWLMMYLTDDEVLKLFINTLTWLKEGGYTFFRESCFGDFDLGENNPTFYRLPSQYNALFHSAFLPGKKDDDQSRGFEIIFSKTLQTYVKVRHSHNQICWLLQKKRIAEYRGYITFQAFLDNQQYAKKSIPQYERMFGEGSISPGGLERAKECIKMLALKPGQKVLDVGCGIGGAAFHMAETYGVEVLGVDLSCNMIEIAMERAAASKTENLQVQFEVCDVTRRDFDPNAFDVIYSSHMIVHIADKSSLFASLLKWTKPGGKLLISDYYCGNPEDHSEDFKEYVKQRGYTICTTAEFGELLSSAGFINVKVEERTKQFTEILRSEKKRLQEKKESFVKDFSAEEYQNILSSWDNKLKWSEAGHHRLGVFYAEKPE
ncbi:uncharacterized protein [Ptychodera flava]|uniref:uncharacterized protein isoform X2 n=1 Tax=Ptychodera flava TaxID=63121 RepID=UPI003969E015